MPNPILLIHGVGSGFKNDTKVKNILDTDREVLLYDYSCVLESSKWQYLFPEFLIKRLSIIQQYEDYTEDVFSYFLDPTIRQRAVTNLYQHLQDMKNGSVTIIAHSLGSVLVWDLLQNKKFNTKELPIDNIIFTGSPLYLNIVWFLSTRKKVPFHITSIKGGQDPICFYGKRTRPFDIEVFGESIKHEPHGYLAHLNLANDRLNIF